MNQYINHKTPNGVHGIVYVFADLYGNYWDLMQYKR